MGFMVPRAATATCMFLAVVRGQTMKLYERTLQSGSSFYIDYLDHAGNRVRHLLKGIKTRKNAELALADFQLRFERNQLGLPTDDNIKLVDVLDARIEERRLAGCVQRWVDCLKNYRSRILAYFGADSLFRALNDKAIASYRMARQAEEASSQTINKELMFLAAAGKIAIDQGKVGKLPWIKIDKAIDRHVDEAWGYLKDDEVTALLRILSHGTFLKVKKQNGRFYPLTVKPSLPMWRMVTFLLNTGARRGEMFALKWSDVSMESRTVRLVSSKSAKNGKSAKPRYIPMNDALVKLFESMERAASNERVFRHDINLRRKFKLALQWAGLPEYRVHDLRHTFASHLVMNGVPLYTVSKLLGHASIETTQRYAHLAPDTFERAVQCLSYARATIGNGIEERTQKPQDNGAHAVVTAMPHDSQMPI